MGEVKCTRPKLPLRAWILLAIVIVKFLLILAVFRDVRRWLRSKSRTFLSRISVDYYKVKLTSITEGDVGFLAHKELT